MTTNELIIEAIGWLFTAITTGIYGYAHGATAIWVKWLIAFFFHLYMCWKIQKTYKKDVKS